jgi:hypothetical protein
MMDAYGKKEDKYLTGEKSGWIIGAMDHLANVDADSDTTSEAGHVCGAVLAEFLSKMNVSWSQPPG